MPEPIRRVATAALLCLALLTPANQAVADEQTPGWTLATADGTPFTLSPQGNDKSYLLLFWATWCPYCKALMPHLESLVLEHDPDEFGILALTLGEDGDPRAFLRQHGYDFTLLPDGDEVAALYGVRGTPGVLIVDRDGRIAFDLRDQEPPSLGETQLSRREMAARRAPWWAAQVRIALRDILESEAAAQPQQPPAP